MTKVKKQQKYQRQGEERNGSVVCHLRLSVKAWRQLQRLAEVETQDGFTEVTPADLVRKAVRNWLEKAL